MKVMSLALDGPKLREVEVELMLLPGLPQIHFLGLPDQMIRESIHRIKSAIRHQGFKFPRTKQIVVNLRPHHFKKSSRGVELAVAAALLWETNQLPKPLEQENFFVYGELGLSGEVFEPEDLKDFKADGGMTVLTGVSKSSMPFQRLALENLKDLAAPQMKPAEVEVFSPVRPEFGLELSYSATQARLLKVLALDPHHALLAGPAGSGKSTLAKAVSSFLRMPELGEISGGNWWPQIRPHHSITELSLIGGGSSPKPGEITRAHKGLLIMDELLEFSKPCQEALREPLEEGQIRISRGAHAPTFPARFQLIATTNLCPCGQWVPDSNVHCRFAKLKCMSYQQRLSGPFLDRFDVLFFSQKEGEGARVTGTEILADLQATRAWRQQQTFDPAARFDDFVRKNIWPKRFSSQRRKRAVFKVSLAMADLEQSVKVQPHHIDQALQLSNDPFERLNGIF